jgi:hypothetical protein
LFASGNSANSEFVNLRFLRKIGNLAESAKANALYATDFDLPLYNVW